MVNAFPAVQVATVDPELSQQLNPVAATPGVGLVCLNGATTYDSVLPAASSGVQPNFPLGISTCVFIFILAITTTDLVVTVKGAALPALPQGQAYLFYGLTAAQVTLSSVLGGQLQYGVGG